HDNGVLPGRADKQYVDVVRERVREVLKGDSHLLNGSLARDVDVRRIRSCRPTSSTGRHDDRRRVAETDWRGGGRGCSCSCSCSCSCCCCCRCGGSCCCGCGRSRRCSC